MRRECRQRLPRHRLQTKPQVSDPGMHHSTCVTHLPWCISGSLTRGGGENVPGIPGECATCNFTYLVNSWVSVHTVHLLGRIGTLIAGQPTILPPRTMRHRPCISTSHTGKHAFLCGVGLRIHHEWPPGYLRRCHRRRGICYSRKYPTRGKENLQIGEFLQLKCIANYI